MKFESIKLHNFMRYKGDNVLEFSIDNEKNVTIVLGDNTFGKTTIAQAFRWGLYEELNTTNYTNKKDIVLLNNEVISQMEINDSADVFVEICVQNNSRVYKFTRKASFARKSNRDSDLSIRQVGSTQLTMQIFEAETATWGDIVNNNGDGKKNKPGCVQEKIESMFPKSLSNYFFFDGERWNDLKSKTNDIHDSINTILGISGLLEMKKHLKDSRTNVLTILRSNIQGSFGEYARIKNEIDGINEDINDFTEKMESNSAAISTLEKEMEKNKRILDDNRKVEDDQRELRSLENDINQYQRFAENSYADMVKLLSGSSQYFAAGLLSELEDILKDIDMKGKDIPGITSDTLDYLINEGVCICGTPLANDSEALANIEKLKKLVPPEMLGGAAGKLQNTLELWKSSTEELVTDFIVKANDYDRFISEIDSKTEEKEKLEYRMDRKTNLGPVRDAYNKADKRIKEINQEQATLEYRIKANKELLATKNAQMDEMAKRNKDNANIYRAIRYAELLYERADYLADQKERNVIKDLNEIIGKNFQEMFNDHEKYAKIESDYKIHVYYRQLGSMCNYEEQNLSNGETIAINFVFIVSILELAEKYREEELQDKESGIEDAVLGLPLVLDGPFSALSNDNTSLVASKLPEFAEQIIIFMLDKDWGASGLDKYTMKSYCYRVNKETMSNSSSLVKN